MMRICSRSPPCLETSRGQHGDCDAGGEELEHGRDGTVCCVDGALEVVGDHVESVVGFFGRPGVRRGF